MSFVQTPEGKPIFPELYSNEEWEALKNSYKIGDFIFPCCHSPAIPKTSINGVKFFAHHTNECSTTPESIWHLAAKNSIAKALNKMDMTAILEQPIKNTLEQARPDIQFQVNNRTIAIEIQHSYQTLGKYISRQERYMRNNVEGYWLLYYPRYITLAKSLARLRIKRDFEGKHPTNAFFPAIPELPVAIFNPGVDDGIVTGAGTVSIPIKNWLQAIIEQKLACINGVWRII